MPTQDERTMSMLTWILGILTSWLGPLIMFIIAKPEQTYLKRHAAMALTLQIVGFVGGIISAILMFVLVGFLTAAALGIWMLVVSIMGAIAANSGSDFRPAIVSDMTRSIFKV